MICFRIQADSTDLIKPMRHPPYPDNPHPLRTPPTRYARAVVRRNQAISSLGAVHASRFGYIADGLDQHCRTALNSVHLSICIFC